MIRNLLIWGETECSKHVTEHLQITRTKLPLHLLHSFMEWQELFLNRNIFICIQSVDIIYTFDEVEVGSREFSICYHVFSFQLFDSEDTLSYITWNLEVGWLKSLWILWLYDANKARSSIFLCQPPCVDSFPSCFQSGYRWRLTSSYTERGKEAERGTFFSLGLCLRYKKAFLELTFYLSWMRLGNRPYYWALKELRRDHLSKMWALPTRKKGRSIALGR